MIEDDFDYDEVRLVAEALASKFAEMEKDLDKPLKGNSLLKGVALIAGWIISSHPNIESDDDSELIVDICNQLVKDVAWSVKLHMQSDSFKADQSLCIPIPEGSVEKERKEGTETEYVDLTKGVRKNTIH